MNKDEIPTEFWTGSFKKEVCMYINDCKQYLKARIAGRPVDMLSEEFKPTEDEYLIIYGLKEVKDLCMSVGGSKPLDWKGN